MTSIDAIANPKQNNSGLSGSFASTTAADTVQVKANLTNPVAEAMPNTQSAAGMARNLDLNEMFIAGQEVPGLHLAYAAARSPIRKVKVTELKNTGVVTYVTVPANCPWPVITKIDGEVVYLFGNVPTGETVEARFIAWGKIKELVEAFAKTKAMIKARQEAINQKRAEEAEAKMASAQSAVVSGALEATAQSPTNPSEQNEG